MSEYRVKIQATVTKTFIVEADSAEEANEKAHEAFTCNSDSNEERYEQDTVNIDEIEKTET